MPAVRQLAEERGRGGERLVPSLDVVLLRADVERDAMRDEPQPVRVLEHLRRHLRHTAEFARQRPFGAVAVAQDAAEHFGAGGGAGDLLDLRLAVHREQADAALEGALDVRLFLDGVADRRCAPGRAPAASTISISAG